MKITLCGSIAFIDEMLETKEKLEKIGHEVKLPPTEIIDNNGKPMSVKEYYAIRKTTQEIDGWIWEKKAEAMRNHFDKVIWAEAILVLNYDKNEVPCYVGANTLLEMGLAFHHNKRIFMLNEIPEVSYKEEILGMQPIVINNNLGLII